MPQWPASRLCKMAIEMHRKVIGRSLICYWPFARFIFHTNVELRTDDNQSHVNRFRTKIRYSIHR